MLISYYIMVISKMAAKMATITLKLAYLLNYLLQISHKGVSHWVFWRHIYLYQIKVHILMMSSKNLRSASSATIRNALMFWGNLFPVSIFDTRIFNRHDPFTPRYNDDINGFCTGLHTQYRATVSSFYL